MKNFVVRGNRLIFNGKIYACAIGKGGFSADKKEGDGATPLGTFALRECWYRADKMAAPKTLLPLKVIHKDDGWCDAPDAPEYNKHIKIPLPLGEGKGEGSYQYVQPEVIDKARTLRQSSTTPEQRLWALLRNRQVGGYKFRRQHPIAPYIADFYCDTLKLIIEIDGESHATNDGINKDKKRTAYLKKLGYAIIRFTNPDIMQNLAGVYEALTLTLSQRERELVPHHEELWRNDDMYDLIVPLGYNDAPVVKGRGSAIFLHIARPGYEPTEGCVALEKNDLLALLAELPENCSMTIENG